MFFLTDIYRYIKLTAAGLGLGSGMGAIVYGAIIKGTGGTALIVLGSLAAANSLFNFFDSSKVFADLKKGVEDLKHEVSDFKQENIELKGNISNLNQAKEKFIEENLKYADMLEENELQLEQLNKVKEDVAKANKDLQAVVEQEKKTSEIYIHENDRLRTSLNALEEAQQKYQTQNQKYQEMLEKTKKQLEELETAKKKYMEENQKLQENNEQNEEQINKLTGQVDKLHKLYNNSRELLKNLAEAGDLFQDFSQTIGQNVVRIEGTADDLSETQEKLAETLKAFETLNSKISASKFKDIDKDGDGRISKEEWQQHINS